MEDLPRLTYRRKYSFLVVLVSLTSAEKPESTLARFLHSIQYSLLHNKCQSSKSTLKKLEILNCLLVLRAIEHLKQVIIWTKRNLLITSTISWMHCDDTLYMPNIKFFVLKQFQYWLVILVTFFKYSFIGSMLDHCKIFQQP